ncbi:MAG TPA: putative ABC exporter domain-containing protein [Xanthomonadales bacterium]|nr:putative ABC exporter domain-containing protein [Xanthomonadales bacterium]
MNAFVTLSYGDRRALVNTLRTLRRRPGRAVMWALYALAIAVFAVFKTGPWTHRRGGVPPPFAFEIWDLWVCGLAIAFGVVLATGTARWLGVFSSRAEALLLMRADAAPVTVAAYLQLRAVGTALAQGLARFAYVIVFALPSGATLPALVAQVAFFAAAGAAVVSVALPRALARGAARTALVVAGWTIAAAAALPLVADALRLARFAGSAALLRRVPAVHPGALLHALGTGDLRALAVPLAIAACATIAFALAARDAYPELYTLSLANLDWRERVRSRRGARRAAAAVTPQAKDVRSTTRTPLRGALAFVWADAVMFGRRVSPPIAALVSALALAAGAALGALARTDNADKVFGVLLGVVPFMYITVASTTGIRLAPTLRMPLFWLGDVPLAARLAAWAFGGFWRDAVLVALAVIGYVAMAREARIPLAIFVTTLGLLALTRTIGLAVFALLPNSLDQRGPGVLLRVWLTFALLVPPAVAATVAALASHAPFAAGAVAATLSALAESALLLAFAGWRLAGRVDNLALA